MGNVPASHAVLITEMQLGELSKSATVIIARCFGITKCLQQWVC
jgi:hypothetical protein